MGWSQINSQQIEQRSVQDQYEQIQTTANQRSFKKDRYTTLQYKPKRQQQLVQQQLQGKVDKTKYKTEMCKNWIETNHCRYKNKCQFAHGEEELAHPRDQELKNYKSKLCKQFHETLFCPYGSRCKFIHEARSFEEVHNYFYVNKLMNLEYNFQMLIDAEQSNSNVQESENSFTDNFYHPQDNKTKGRRLPIFQYIEESGSEQEEGCLQDEPKFENEYYSDKETQHSSSSSDASRRESLISHRSSKSFKSDESSYESSPSMSYFQSNGQSSFFIPVKRVF